MSGNSSVDIAISNPLGEIYVRAVTGVQLEAVLFGILTAALASTLYTSFRSGIRPYFTRKRASLARLVAFILVHALFTFHWIFSIKYTQDLSMTAYLSQYRPVVTASYGPLIAESVLFGMFCVLVAQAVYVFVRKGLRSRSQQAMLAAVLCMYTISLSHWVLQIPLLQPDTTHSEEQESRITPAGLAILMLLTVNVLLSDAIVLWRMCVLYDDDIFIRTLAALLILSTIGLTGANLATEALFQEPIDEGIISFSFTKYGTAILALSLASNVVATLSIGWKVWHYRKDISAHLASFNHRSVVEKTMTIFAESGCIYCIIWILYMLDSVGIDKLIQYTAPTPLAPFGTGNPVWFSRLMPQLTGIYPTIIIVIVALERSYLENALSDSKLSAFVAARPETPEPRSDSHSQRGIMSYAPSRSVGRDARDIRLESVSSDVPVADVVDVGEEDRVFTVEGRDDRAGTVQRATQGDFGSFHSVHVEPRQAVPVQDPELLAQMSQGTARSSLVLQPRRSHLSPAPTIRTIPPTVTDALVLNPPLQAPYVETPDFGPSILAHVREYGIWTSSEDEEYEDEYIPASPGSDRRAPSPARRSA